jgi:hypothetical protein
MDFIEQMRPLSEADIRAVIELRKTASEGSFREWLEGLPL